MAFDPNALPPELLAAMAGGAPAGPPLGFPIGPPPDSGSPTSPPTGSTTDLIRKMIEIGSLYLRVETDDADLSEMQSILAKLQSRLAKESQSRDKALGVTPELKAMGRATRSF